MFPMFTSNVFDQICCWRGSCSITWHLRWLSRHKTTASVALLSNKWYSDLKFLFLSFFLFQISMNVWEVVLIVTKTHGVRTLRAHINASAKKGIMGMEPVVKSETCAHKFAWCIVSNNDVVFVLFSAQINTLFPNWYVSDIGLKS